MGEQTKYHEWLFLPGAWTTGKRETLERQSKWGRTYHKGLIESEEHDQLDAQELSQRLLLLELLFGEVIEHEQAVQRDAEKFKSLWVKSEGRDVNYARDADEVNYAQVHICMRKVALAQYVKSLTNDPNNGDHYKST